MISIITPTYNSEEYLEECILSIMNQKEKNYEHIIVDGGSTDGTIKIIKKYYGKYNMKWISESDKGMYDAINKGIKMSKGDILAWLNSDDIYLPWATQVMETVCSKGIQWCTCINAHFNKETILYLNPKSYKIYPQKLIAKGMMEGRKLGSIQQESTFWTRELWEKSGGLDINYKLAGDYNLWTKFAQFEKLYVTNSVIAGFRIHSRQMSSDKEKYYNEISKLNIYELILSKMKVYKIINALLRAKYKSNVIDIQNLN